jgi:NAD(P)-dependent dehydrogenase (short-subunit alcohol dehydrogenase family)
MSDRLSGKTALVTGSTNNIGRAVAQLFAAEGAHVIVSGRDQARGESVVAGIRARGGRADLVRADLDGSSKASKAIAAAALYLASDEAGFVHGTVIDVDGDRVGVAVIAAA